MQKHARSAVSAAGKRRIPGVSTLLAALGAGTVCAMLTIMTAIPAAAQDKPPVDSSAKTAGDPAFIQLRAGYIGDIVANRDAGGWFNFEYRAGPELEFFHVRPSLGVGAATNGSAYVWLGANLDIYFGRRLVLTPTTGIGAYYDGDGQDLGGVLEFRNGIDLAWRFDSRARLGIGFHYLSNYGIFDDNPGIGSVTAFYALPLGEILP